jgi:hypothetical protein
VEAIHSVGRGLGVEDVIVAEDFTFAAAAAKADDVTHARRAGRAYVV